MRQIRRKVGSDVGAGFDVGSGVGVVVCSGFDVGTGVGVVVCSGFDVGTGVGVVVEIPELFLITVTVMTFFTLDRSAAVIVIFAFPAFKAFTLP